MQGERVKISQAALFKTEVRMVVDTQPLSSPMRRTHHLSKKYSGEGEGRYSVDAVLIIIIIF